MNHYSTRILSLIICLDLVLAPFPKSFAADTPVPAATEEASTAAYFKMVQEEAEHTFGPDGCAQIQSNGTAIIKNQTTADCIHSLDPENKGALDCETRVKALSIKWNRAMELKKEYEKTEKSKKHDEQCAECGIAAKTINTDFMLPKDALCTKRDKDQLKAERDSGKNPACSTGSEFAPGKLLSLQCAKDIVTSFFSSIGSMLKTVWTTAVGAKNFVVGLFSGNHAAETAATDRGMQFAGMSQDEITKAQKDPEGAKRSFTQKLQHAMEVLGEFMMLDVPAYKELWQCARCGERAEAFCKIVGVLGKDSVKYALLDLIAGQAIGLVAKKLNPTLLEKVAEGLGVKKVVQLASKKFLPLSDRAIAKFAKYTADGVGKTTKDFFLKPSWEIVKGVGTIALGVNHVVDTALKMPTKLFIRAGRKVWSGIAGVEVADHLSLFKNFFKKEDEKVLKDGSAASIAKVAGSEAPLEIETRVTRATATKQMLAGADVIDSMNDLNARTAFKAGDHTRLHGHLASGNKIHIDKDELLNAVEHTGTADVQPAGKSVKISSEAGDQYFRVNDPTQVKSVYTYGKPGKEAIIRMKDDSLWIAHDGYIATRIAKNDPKALKSVEALLGKDQAEVDAAAARASAKAAAENGIKEDVVNSSGDVPESKFKTSEACGDQTITVRAGRAF